MAHISYLLKVSIEFIKRFLGRKGFMFLMYLLNLEYQLLNFNCCSIHTRNIYRGKRTMLDLFLLIVKLSPEHHKYLVVIGSNWLLVSFGILISALDTL